MWPFSCKKEPSKAKQALERLVTGFIIGGAIGSILGKKILDKHEEDDEDEDEEKEDDNGFEDELV
ncbi:hypothetical protein KJ652_02510 [Patescibacteria group bacterium]|nr:hypothetical protein [Patescibacteria group bacterium]MBU1123439.1 hypothetical protein [Patescibacteria group bacterium]